MFRELCNQLRTRIQKEMQSVIGQVAGFLASKVGLKVVAADAVLLPKGFMMFDSQLAKAHGVERAVIYQKIKGWQEYNCRQSKRSHFRDERWWTYGKPQYWLDNEFIWSSLSTIRRAFTDLEKAGLLLIDSAGGDFWLSAIAGENVNLKATPSSLQLGLFNLDSAASNRRTSIGNRSTLKQTKGKKQTTISPRKDAVADFSLPETRNQADVEMHESRDGEVEGRDVLFELPGELVTAWTDAKMPLEQLVALHGVDRVNAKWQEAEHFKNRVAGLRTLLGKSSSPSSAPPPSSGDTTEQDWTEDDIPGNETPPADDDPMEAFRFIREYNAKSAPPPICAPTISPEPAKWWEITYSQLGIQLDRASFETFLRDTQLVSVEGDVWLFAAANKYAADMLNHRLNRELCRVLSDVTGIDRKQLVMRFEAKAVQHG